MLDSPAMVPAPRAAVVGLALAVLLSVALCFAGLGRSLWGPDEPTGAAVGRAMVATGDLVIPRLNGEPFLEKPPLYWWVQVASLRTFGISAAAARLPSALFGAATLLVAWALGRRLGPGSALLAPLVLASTALFVEETGRVVVDPALAFFVALVHLGFVQLAAPRSSAERRRALLLIALALPLAFLSKGVVAIGLGAVPPAVYLLATRRRQALADLLPLLALGLPLFALLVLPWSLALYHHGGWPAVQECLLNNTFGRFLANQAGRVYGHRQPVWYYLTTAPAVLLPWSLALPAMLRSGVFSLRDARHLADPGDSDGDARRLLGWTVVLGVLFLSAAASKRELYLLPLLPAFAAATAAWLDGIARRPADLGRWDRPTLRALAGFAVPLAVLVPVAAAVVRFVPPRQANLAPLREALSPATLALWSVAALGIAALALASCRRPSVTGVILPFLLLFLGIQTAVKAAIDPVKNLDDLATAVSRLVPDNPVPASLSPRASSESLFGILGFRLNRQTLPLTTPDALAAYAAAHPGAPVVFRMEEVPRLPAGIRSRLRFLYDETGRKGGPYGIAVLSPASPAVPALPGDPPHAPTQP